MSKRAQRKRSARRTGAVGQQRASAAQAPSRKEVKPRVAKSGVRRGRLATLLQNRTALGISAAALLIIVLVLVWLFATPWSPLSRPTPTSTSPATGAKRWSAPPPMSIDTSKSYYATIKTEKGDIGLDLFDDKAPRTVNNFVFLARQGFYDNTTFHRVIAGFMAQGGDPTGTGTGGPGYRFEDEFDPTLRHDSAGILSMANAGANTNGSQFFITYAPQPHLDDQHTVFGKVVSGMDVLESLTPRDPDDPNAPPGTKIFTIVIEEK